MGRRLDAWNEQRLAYGREAYQEDMRQCTLEVDNDPSVVPLATGTAKQRDYADAVRVRTLAYILKEIKVVEIGADAEVEHEVGAMRQAYQGLAKIAGAGWWCDRSPYRSSEILRQWIATGGVQRPSKEEADMAKAVAQERAWEAREKIAEAERLTLGHPIAGSPDEQVGWQRLLAAELAWDVPAGNLVAAAVKDRWVRYYRAQLAAAGD